MPYLITFTAVLSMICLPVLVGTLTAIALTAAGIYWERVRFSKG